MKARKGKRSGNLSAFCEVRPFIKGAEEDGRRGTFPVPFLGAWGAGENWEGKTAQVITERYLRRAAAFVV